MVEWSPGQWVEARVSQYMAYIDGRIEEVALDLYAQADDGSVWYLGEDVSTTASKGLSTAPRAPGSPEGMAPGDDHARRPPGRRRAPGREHPRRSPSRRSTIKRIDKTVNGPTGPVEGAMVGP